MRKIFCAPSSYMENFISGVAPKIGFDLEEDKDIFHILLSDSSRPKKSTLYCKCRIKEDKKLELYKGFESTLKRMRKIFCAPSSYMENFISGVAPKIGFDLEEDKDIFHILLSDSSRPKKSTLYCKCRIKEDKKLELYKAFYAYKVGVFIVMAYIPPHKRHSKDSEMPSPIPERLVPQFSRQVNLKSSSNANARNVSSVRSMYIVGLDADNQFPSSVHLVPTSIESFKQRMYENPLVLVNSHPATKEIDEEGEAISSTPLGTISSTPWESVAVDVWPKLLSAFEIVRDMLESNDELDEVKPAIYARFGKILFHPNASVSLESLIKDRVAETTLRQMNTTFYTNTSSSYMENIISGVAPKIGFDLEEDKDMFHIVLSDDIRKCGIYCKCRMKEDKKLELYKVETNPIYEMIKNILCIDKNIDLRLALQTKRILTSLTDDEMHGIRNIINSAIIDPEVKGGLRWPYGKACSGDRFAVVEIWHTIAKKYKSRSLSLMVRRVDRFMDAYGEDKIEVNLKLKRLVSDLQGWRSATIAEQTCKTLKSLLSRTFSFWCREKGAAKDDRRREKVGDRWRLSDHGLLKINCNTRVDKRRRQTGFGFIVKDDGGRVMVCCAQVCEANYDLESAKAMTVYKGLIFCRDIGLENYVVETDLESMIKQIVKGGNSESRYGGILDLIEVLAIVSASRNVTFQCASKKAYKVAWVLANEALGIPNMAVWKKDAQFVSEHCWGG
ncbi:hypothetical protein EZV62_007496 [Acer yangbiense]|uniref:Uncharacterized protein n=1 Tax=Acer yangbiense TaxID=1000413 RepID=A0A5C7IAV4_9ROSI|nr:hypothetical protein EZV62_007496 [Acer yangbiense]